MEKVLPYYDLLIDDNPESELEVNYVALVDLPAIEKNFLAFKDNKPLQFAIQEDRHIISGPAMLADFPIYRRDDDMGEYFVKFSAETIYTIVQKFFSKKFNANFNLFHDAKVQPDGICVFESFITDPARGIYPMKGFEDAPVGSWFISAKVDNEELWKGIKEGTVRGFSVEGMFKYKKQQLSKEQEQFNAIMEILKNTQL